jgi:hypothetical protein
MSFKCPYTDCSYHGVTHCMKFEDCAMDRDAIVMVKYFLERLQRKETHYMNKDEFKEVDESIKLLESIL